MTISVKTRSMLWGRAAARCSFPKCLRPLFLSVDAGARDTNIGEIAHIVAKEPGGPRGSESLPVDQRDEYENLILLCPVHHKLVDDQEDTYSAATLRAMRTGHEEWVMKNLDIDAGEQRDKETYAMYMDKFAELSRLEEWDAWTSHLVSHGQPALYAHDFDRLIVLNEWLFSRVWPGRYRDLEGAFENFRRVLQDLLKVFLKYAGSWDERLMTRKFYHIDKWDPERYEQLSQMYDFHVGVVDDLALELTRAANLICDLVRGYIAPDYLLEEGRLVVTHGPYLEDLGFRSWRPQYGDEERTELLYPGIKAFLEIRQTRDYVFGSGTEEDVTRFLRDVFPEWPAAPA